MLTGKQRAYLRGLATKENAIVHIGKTGITDNLIKQVEDALEARELVKATVLDNSMLEVKGISIEVAKLVNADVVQAIGKKFTLYRKSKKSLITLP